MSNATEGTALMAQGRIVWVTGPSLFEGRPKTDFNTKQPVIGPDGQPKIEYGFGLAIPKLNPATGQNTEEYVKAYQAIHGEALKLFPGGQLPPGFALKYKDGDSVDHSGKNFSDREGYANHIVIACSTQLPITFFKFENGNNMIVNTGIKCGDYVNVQLLIKGHAAQGAGKAGLYVNPSAVQLIQPGPAIINTPSGDQMFGNAAPVYSGQAIADTAPVMPQVAAAPMTPVMPQVAAAPMTPVMPQVAAAPITPADPHYGVLPQNMHPAAPAPVAGNAVPPVAAAPMPGTTPAAIAPSPMGSGPAMPVTPSANVPVMPAVAGQVANVVPMPQ